MKPAAKKKFSAAQAARLFIQIVCFIFLPALFVGVLGGLRQLWTVAVTGSFSAALWPQIVEVLAIVPVTVIFGRFFCGWMCAFGALGDFLYRIFHKFSPAKRRISAKNDARMKKIKYFVLAFVVIVVWTAGVSAFQSASPWDVFGLIATVGQTPDFASVFPNLAAGFVIFLAVMGLSAVYERFFCRYLCPLGAFFSAVSGLRIGKVRKPTAGCGSCRACTNACAMGIELAHMEAVSSGECIDCMKCVTVCPRRNAQFAVAKSDVRPLAAGTAAAAMMAGFYYTGSFAAGTGVSASGTTSADTTALSVQRTYADGTYQGTGTGYRNGTTVVSVTISNDEITSVTTVSTGDTDRFYSSAFQTVVKDIIASQSAGVDAVSGATYSSRGIIQAVENALAKAKSAVTVSDAVASEFASSASSSPETSSVPSSGTIDIFGSSSTSSSQPVSSAASSASSSPSSAYQDGTYQGTGTGYRSGETVLSVTISGGQITSVATVSTGDTDRFYNSAFQTVVKEIIASQSAGVDAVSGATYSSRGIMQAVADALASAQKT